MVKHQKEFQGATLYTVSRAEKICRASPMKEVIVNTFSLEFRKLYEGTVTMFPKASYSPSN